MPYIKRGSDGVIVALSQDPETGFDEQVDADNPELAVFIEQWGKTNEELARSDLAFVRVVEDIVDLLISKNIICFTDLPEAARDKMLARRQLRKDLDPRLESLLGDEDEENELFL